jgi:hypothetical protein
METHTREQEALLALLEVPRWKNQRYQLSETVGREAMETRKSSIGGIGSGLIMSLKQLIQRTNGIGMFHFQESAERGMHAHDAFVAFLGTNLHGMQTSVFLSRQLSLSPTRLHLQIQVDLSKHDLMMMEEFEALVNASS